MTEDSLHVAENGPPERVWSALAPSVEAENVAAEEEGIHTMRHIEQESLDKCESTLNSGIENCLH